MMTTETPIPEWIRLRDLPTRVGHWLLTAAFFLSFLTGDSEAWLLAHIMAGSALAGVLVFRLFWGYARFGPFPFAPREVFAYLRSQLKRNPNPASSYAIYTLLLLGSLAAASGWAAYCDVGGERMVITHDLLSYAMLGAVSLHMADVIVNRLLRRENPMRGMINGCKRNRCKDSIAARDESGGLPLLFGSMACAVLLVLLS